jgi:hypothetical protein
MSTHNTIDFSVATAQPRPIFYNLTTRWLSIYWTDCLTQDISDLLREDKAENAPSDVDQPLLDVFAPGFVSENFLDQFSFGTGHENVNQPLRNPFPESLHSTSAYSISPRNLFLTGFDQQNPLPFESGGDVYMGEYSEGGIGSGSGRGYSQ